MKLLRGSGGVLSLALLLGLTVSSVPAGAQTVTAFSVERSLALTNILTTLTPQIPASLLASIAGGALDVREQTNYNPQQSTLTSTLFVVPTGAPTPTSLGALPANSVVAVVTQSIDKIYVVPTSKVVSFVGTITQSTATPYGILQGLPDSFSFAYSGDAVPKITGVFELVAGTIVLYSPTATGTVTITSPATGGGGGGGTGVTIVVGGPGSASGTSFQTTINQVFLDASKSTSANPGALTYSLIPAPGFPSANITFGNTAMPAIQLSSGRGTYQFILTVTDATGVAATATITIQYI